MIKIYGFKIVGYLERAFKLLSLLDVADLNCIEFDENIAGAITWYETCHKVAFCVNWIIAVKRGKTFDDMTADAREVGK